MHDIEFFHYSVEEIQFYLNYTESEIFLTIGSV